jgi:hypothetical protein
MKQCLIIIIFFLAACNNASPEKQQAAVPAKQDPHIEAFNQWLSTHHIDPAHFNDTVASPSDSLWAYSFPLERTDSLYRWYPSTDSSFYLLTNIDRETRQNIFKKAEDMEYRFLDTRSGNVHIGITLLYDKTNLAPIDIHWHDPETIYLLEQDKNNSGYELIKLRMNRDTIWSYRHTN